MNGDIVVRAPSFNSMFHGSSGLGSDFFSDSPIINFAGINAQLRELIDGIDGHTGSPSPVLLASLLNPPNVGNGHKPPAGYHFGAMDPLGEHYMIRDGDPKNALIATPWYAEQVKHNLEAFNTSVADISLGLLGVSFLPGGSSFAAFVGGVLTVLSWGAAHSSPLQSPILP